MATLGELTVRTNIETAGLERGLARLRSGMLSVDEASRLPQMAVLNSRLDAMQRRMDLSTAAVARFNAGLRSTGTALSIGITAPIIGLGVSVGSAAAQMDSLRRGLTAVTGSAADTAAQIARLEEVAKLPGLGFREAIQGSITLQAAGLSAGFAERSLRAFGNALATVGKGKAELDGVNRALTQIANKTKVSAEEINQLAERVPQIRQAMIAAFGTADTEIIQKMGLAPKAFIEGLVKELEKLPRVTGGAANSFENFSDALFRARAAIGERLLPALLPLVDGLTSMLTQVRTLNPDTVKWGIAIAGVAAVAGPLIIVISSLASAVTALTAALAIGLLPVIAVGGPILIALAALSALWAKNKLDALEAAGAANAYRASLLGLSEAQLVAAQTHLQLDMVQIRSAQRSLREQQRAFRPEVRVPSFVDRLREGGLGAALNPFSSTAQPRTVAVETREFRELGNAANDATAKIHQIGAALRGLRATGGPSVTPPPRVSPGTGTDKLAGTLDNLTDRLREFQALQKFVGAQSVSLLPEDAADQIRLVNALAAELDTLTDGLRRFQAAGRQPPAGLTFGINALNEQLKEAERRLDNLARLYNETRMLAVTTERLPRVQVAPGGVEVRGGTPFRARGEAPETRSFMGDFKEGLAQITAQFSPLNLALSAVNAVLAPLQPLLNALLVPFTIMGQILSLLIVPVLRVLFYPLKLLGIVVSYIGEVIAKVAGAIATAIGSLVRGIGRLVNKLPGSPGDPLVKAGQAMIDLGNQFKDAAKDMAARRKELEKLSFDDALEGVNNGLEKLEESLTNVPPLFNLALRRLQAASGGASVPQTGGGATPPPFAPPRTPGEPQRPIAPVVIFVDANGNPKEPTSDWRRLMRGIASTLERSSDPEAKSMALTLRMAG